jgi:uncharacterized protein YciI
MPPEKDDKIAELLKPMLKKRLFVALSKAVARPEQMLPFVAEHLEYMNQLENEGKLFASGPFIQEGVLVGDGLTILHQQFSVGVIQYHSLGPQLLRKSTAIGRLECVVEGVDAHADVDLARGRARLRRASLRADHSPA